MDSFQHFQSLPQLQIVFHISSSSVVAVKDKLNVIEMVSWVSGEGNVKNYCQWLVGVGDLFGTIICPCPLYSDTFSHPDDSVAFIKKMVQWICLNRSGLLKMTFAIFWLHSAVSPSLSDISPASHSEQSWWKSFAGLQTHTLNKVW